MACYHPIEAYRLADGSVSFVELARYDVVGTVDLPCGRCVGCRLERSRQWALRCVHEAKAHEANCFVTLTYDNEHLPDGGSLRHRDVQLFLKRLRRRVSPNRVRFFMCGEYGTRLGRPHYHVCFFGLDFPDRKYAGKTESGAEKYLSDSLTSLWGLGDTQVSDFNFKAAAYTARYIMEKVTGDEAAGYYQRLDTETGELFELAPEYCSMSKRPGVGARYVDNYFRDMLESGTCVLEGREVNLPRFYEKRLRKFVEYESLDFQRYLRAKRNFADQSPDRRAVREQVAKARLKFKKRHEGFQ